MQTLTIVYSSAQILILLAMGATLVMLTRNIDVSVGSITGVVRGAVGDVTERRIFTTVACVATLLLGLLAGFFDGVLVASLRIPAIVATLGTLGLYRGIMLLWTGGKWIEGLPAELKELSAPLLFGVSAIGWLTIILVAFMARAGKDGVWTQFFMPRAIIYRALVNWGSYGSHSHCGIFVNGCMAALAGMCLLRRLVLSPTRPVPGWR